ncbi:site-specific recombination directionality factor RDF [Mycobacterium phage Kimona]|uniref:RDF protein n=1 Tax=Mycobacterium phage Kimona TaxID=2024295 RepID=A0A249XUC7_9CAUD|nr:site-specific recombination directionality factor RDF [Mycobacterium phage Kimona]ASZ75512.1 hypothetical protein PBI_KIMONA_76 [Mycobacterium phage Kimona]
MRAFIYALLVAAAFTGLALFTSGPAEAAPSSACLAHLADKQTHTTPAADRRYHLQRGEPSPCSEQDAQGGEESPASPVQRDDQDKRDGGKSRFCRKHWFC